MNAITLDPYIRWHHSAVTQSMRESRNGHRGILVWFTGLPTSGKSTLAHGLEELLFRDGHSPYVLDGDNLRHGLCRDLGFSQSDRAENIRRIGELAKLFVNAGFITLAAFISPYTRDRENVRELVGRDRYLEVYCRCPIDVCESRDRKGNYTKARAGIIASFTGISAPYEVPSSPDLVIDTAQSTVEESVATIHTSLCSRQIFA